MRGSHASSLGGQKTVEHSALYASAGLFGGILLAFWLRNRREDTSIGVALPPGYGLSLIGAGLFLAAGLGDLVWHVAFGIEENIDALLSPTHLALAASGFLMVFGPVRSAWSKGPPASFSRWLPWATALTMGLAILGAFTQYVHPQSTPGRSKSKPSTPGGPTWQRSEPTEGPNRGFVSRAPIRSGFPTTPTMAASSSAW